MNEGDKISEKIKKIWKQNLSVPNYGPQDQKMCKISAVHKTITLFLFGFKYFSVILHPCTNSLTGFLWLIVFLWNYAQKQNLPRYAQIFGPNFCHISKNISPTQKILFKWTDIVPINIPWKFWVTSTKSAEDMNRRVEKTRFEKIAVKVYNTYIKLKKA